MVDPFIMEDVTECLQAAEPRKFLDPAEKPQKKDHVFNALQKLGVAERQAYIHLHVVWCDRGIDIGFEWIIMDLWYLQVRDGETGSTSFEESV